MAENYISRGTQIKEKHQKWLEENNINYSSWVRTKLDEEMAK